MDSGSGPTPVPVCVLYAFNRPAAVNNRDLTGVEPLLWGSDYPHDEGTWPHTREAVERTFVGVPDADRAAMLGGTLAKLYDFEVEATFPVNR